MNATTMQWIGSILFAVAIVHTFCATWFDKLAHRHPRHEGLFHLAGEVEVVFGLWAMVLVAIMAVVEGGQAATHYVDSRNYTEPMFVFVIMVVAASQPVMQVAATLVRRLAALLPLPPAMAFTATVLTVVPLLGSFITEPAAMTLAALMLSGRLYAGSALPASLRYGILGVLFVNISIGGTLTQFAAPPVLMVAHAWGWDLPYMMTHFGWKAAIACVINTAVLLFVFRRALGAAPLATDDDGDGEGDGQGEGQGEGRASGPVDAKVDDNVGAKVGGKGAQARSVPPSLQAVYVAMLAAVVLFAHEPPMFIGVFLLFLGIGQAYPRYQNRLIVREALLVAFFLAGLVVLGGLQQWWLKPLLLSLSAEAVYWGATALTAITDNAALTYLGSLVEGLSDEFRYALVAGAVTGGGLTVIANAPNPAGLSILRRHFDDGSVSAGRLLLAALGPTAVAAAAFRLL